MPVTAQRLLALMNGEDVSLAGLRSWWSSICLQTETWLRELRDAQKTPVRA